MDVDGWETVDHAIDSRPAAEYDDRTFLHFVRVEQARSERFDHAVWLLLVSVAPVGDEAVPLGSADAARLFAELRASVRDADVIGWYQQDRVAGALLSADAETAGSEISHVIQHRVDTALRTRLPALAARGLRVRVILL